MKFLRFLPFLLLTTALADRVTVTATGLPAGLQGTALVGQVSIPLGGTATVPAGTYTVTPRAVADGGRVYVAQPVKVKVKGQTVAKVNYSKLPAGSADPFFGKNGVLSVGVAGLETSDSWVVYSEGTAPIVTSTGSFRDGLAQLLTMNGTPLGSITKVTTTNRPLGDGRISTGLLNDGTGYLAGLSSISGTVIRFDAKGQLDTAWTTNPAQGIYVRGLLRLPDGGVLAYGGTYPSLWKLKSDGASDSTFGEGGILKLPDSDAFQSGIRSARLLPSGLVRLVIVDGIKLQLVDLHLDKDPKAVAVAAPLTLPSSGTPPYNTRNVTQADDGTIIIVTTDVPNNTAQIVKITAEGKMDAHFAAPIIKNVSAIVGTALQRDGKLVAAFRNTNGDSSISRFNADGSDDKTFGKNGTVSLASNGQVYALEIGADGKINVISAGLATPLTPKTAYIRITRLLSE